MDTIRAIGTLAVMAGVTLPGVAIARRIWIDDAYAWAALAGVLGIGAVLGGAALMLAWSRWRVYSADADAAAAVRSRIYGTLDVARDRSAPGGAMPWLMMDAMRPQLPAGTPTAAYDPRDVVDAGYVARE